MLSRRFTPYLALFYTYTQTAIFALASCQSLWGAVFDQK